MNIPKRYVLKCRRLRCTETKVGSLGFGSAVSGLGSKVWIQELYDESRSFDEMLLLCSFDGGCAMDGTEAMFTWSRSDA
jgi:hypothetical protein